MLEKKQLAPHQIDIWQVSLDQPDTGLKAMLSYLSEDEKERAYRFHFPLHQQRFIFARAYLRLILASYLNKTPKELTFIYNEHQKPSLAPHPCPAQLLAETPISLQFNLSHTENVALYAFKQADAIGIDIEYIKDEYNQNIAKRFFNPSEIQQLTDLPSSSRRDAFYQLWARKEAVVKTVGKGLLLPLSSFSVSLANQPQTIPLSGYSSLRLIPLNLYPDYAAAVCCEGIVQKISIYNIIGQISKLETTYDF